MDALPGTEANLQSWAWDWAMTSLSEVFWREKHQHSIRQVISMLRLIGEPWIWYYSHFQGRKSHPFQQKWGYDSEWNVIHNSMPLEWKLPAVIKVQFSLPVTWFKVVSKAVFLIKVHLENKLVVSCTLTTQSSNHISRHLSIALRFIIPNYYTILSLPPKAMYQLVTASTGGSHKPSITSMNACAL